MEKKNVTYRFRRAFTVSVKMTYEYLDDATISKNGTCTDDLIFSAATSLTPYLCNQIGGECNEYSLLDVDENDLLVPSEAYELVIRGLRRIEHDLLDLYTQIPLEELAKRTVVAGESSDLLSKLAGKRLVCIHYTPDNHEISHVTIGTGKNRERYTIDDFVKLANEIAGGNSHEKSQ